MNMRAQMIKDKIDENRQEWNMQMDLLTICHQRYEERVSVYLDDLNKRRDHLIRELKTVENKG